MDFLSFWARLRAIRPGTPIPTWTVDHGYFGHPFVLGEVAADSVLIQGPRVRVPKLSFAPSSKSGRRTATALSGAARSRA
jgi:hypothetical protein